jgi:hypothetical protein
LIEGGQMHKHIITIITCAWLINTTLFPKDQNPFNDLPPYVSVLTEWGQRPEWSLDGKYIYFMLKDYSEVFRIEPTTRKIKPVTAHYFHESYNRVLCLGNGDLLLTGPDRYDSSDPWASRHNLKLYVLRAPFDRPAMPLHRSVDEGPAVSKTDNRFAWTLPGQREIMMAELEYDTEGKPVLANEKKILSFDELNYPMSQRLETQDFLPNSNKLIFTFYRGTDEEPFYFADPYYLDLDTGAIEPIIDNKRGYDEAEGVSPDGKFLMIESDRHTEPMKWNLDVYMLQLDGSGTIERLLDWSDKYPGCHSDNPVVSPDGTTIAIQFGFRINQPGQGRGIVLFDLKKYRQFKK